MRRPKAEDDGDLAPRIAKASQLAGLVVDKVEMRCGDHDTRACSRTVALTEPGLANQALVKTFWPQALRDSQSACIGLQRNLEDRSEHDRTACSRGTTRIIATIAALNTAQAPSRYFRPFSMHWR